jgi:hypothetical protein
MFTVTWLGTATQPEGFKVVLGLAVSPGESKLPSVGFEKQARQPVQSRYSVSLIFQVRAPIQLYSTSPPTKCDAFVVLSPSNIKNAKSTNALKLFWDIDFM